MTGAIAPRAAIAPRPGACSSPSACGPASSCRALPRRPSSSRPPAPPSCSPRPRCFDLTGSMSRTLAEDAAAAQYARIDAQQQRELQAGALPAASGFGASSPASTATAAGTGAVQRIARSADRTALAKQTAAAAAAALQQAAAALSRRASAGSCRSRGRPSPPASAGAGAACTRATTSALPWARPSRRCPPARSSRRATRAATATRSRSGTGTAPSRSMPTSARSRPPWATWSLPARSWRCRATPATPRGRTCTSRSTPTAGPPINPAPWLHAHHLQ